MHDFLPVPGLVTLVADLAEVDFRQFGGRVEGLLLHVVAREVHACARADVAEPVPLVHAVFAYADFDVQTVVVLTVDLTS